MLHLFKNSVVESILSYKTFTEAVAQKVNTKKACLRLLGCRPTTLRKCLCSFWWGRTESDVSTLHWGERAQSRTVKVGGGGRRAGLVRDQSVLARALTKTLIRDCPLFRQALYRCSVRIVRLNRASILVSGS